MTTSKESVIILAIESSCDDTSVAILKDGRILCNLVAGQEVHRAYGGVVPELASRAHQQHIVPLVDQALKDTHIVPEELSAIAFTAGPGLLGSLLVGSSFAKAFALGLNIPLIAVNHMEAHILAHFIDEPKPSFPFLCLTVSGGHTLITILESPFEHRVLGRTLDDAAGEAFDKAAKMLEFPYPGGPLIDQFAQQGNPAKFTFANPQISGLDFSFSGIKTSFLYFLQDARKKNPEFVQENKADLCASMQKTIVDHLMKKLIKAAKETGIKEIAIAGGVSANSALRHELQEAGKRLGWKTFIPEFQYCTDNAAMIAITAWYKYLNRDFASQAIAPYASLPASI